MHLGKSVVQFLYFLKNTMHFAIFTDALNKAHFIQKGLKGEDISSKIFQDFHEIHLYKFLNSFDGIFIVSDEPSKYENFLTELFEFDDQFVAVLFSTNKSDQIQSFLSQFPAFTFFCDPFPFRKIAYELRTSLYNIKEVLDDSKYILRDISLDVEGHMVRMGDYAVYLRNKEFSLLRYFMSHPGKLLTRTTILEDVWAQNTNLMTNTVDVHVSQLRKKIKKYTGTSYIKTIPCLGYVFE